MIRKVLPTCDNLARRRVFVDDLCPLCRDKPETSFHLFVECSFARNCWYHLGLGYFRGAMNDFDEWLAFVLKHGDVSSRGKVVVVLWQIWKQRNNVL